MDDECLNAFNYLEEPVFRSLSSSSQTNLRKVLNFEDYEMLVANKSKSNLLSNNNNSNNNNVMMNDRNNNNSNTKKRRHSTTDIFARNSSFILNHEYNEEHIYQLLCNSNFQTKRSFVSQIWPNTLRVVTRVFNDSNFRCPICLDKNISFGRITQCGHCFCGMCLLHHLWNTQNQENSKNNINAPIMPNTNDPNLNFNDLFGYCPLCSAYVSFEHCRPLTLIRQKKYKETDLIDLVLLIRRKGEQPIFSLNDYNEMYESLDITTFKKFMIEFEEYEKCGEELNKIKKIIASSDPIYEQPYLRLLSMHIKQYQKYVLEQRTKYSLFTQKKHSTKSPQITYYHNNSDSNSSYRSKKKYVYQSCDGQLIFLHPTNYNMLKQENNHNFFKFPSILKQCKILQIEEEIQSYEIRRKYPFLAFIPLGVAFNFVELDLSHMISKHILNNFKEELHEREILRLEQKKKIEEEKQDYIIKEQKRIENLKKKHLKPDINDLSSFPSLPSFNDDSFLDDNNNENDSKYVNKYRAESKKIWAERTNKSPHFQSKSATNLMSKCNLKNSPSDQNGNNSNNHHHHNPQSHSLDISAPGKTKKRRKRGRNKKKNHLISIK